MGRINRRSMVKILSSDGYFKTAVTDRGGIATGAGPKRGWALIVLVVLTSMQQPVLLGINASGNDTQVS